MRLRWLLTGCAVSLTCASLVLAASGTIRLKDGRTLVGEYRKVGNSYSILMPDGTRTLVTASEIVDIDGKPLEGSAAASAGATASAGASPTGPSAASAGGAFRAIKSKADRVDAPIVAVQLWDDFIKNNPASSDLEAARAERDIWNKLYKDNAEKVKGKWIGGQDLKDLKKKCDDLYREAVDPGEDGVKGVQGLRKLDEIIKIYPRHFGANYMKGYYNLVQAGRTRQGSTNLLLDAIKALEATSQIAPTVPEVWANLAIGYNWRREYQKSIESAYRAVKIRGDDPALLETLAMALYDAPPQIRDVNPKVREINIDAQALFSRYGVKATGGWRYHRPKVKPGDTEPDDVKTSPGVQWSGSGFFISTDGYLITNHHVAAGDAKSEVPKGITFRVRTDDGQEVPARLIAMDDKADIALMKVDLPAPVVALPIAKDNPEQGAEALVLGYPATGSVDKTLQISKGTVKSVHDNEEYHVWYDLNTTHGNSGGPIVDRDGSVISILTAGGQVYNMTIVYGVGPNQIETFLTSLADRGPKVSYVSPKSDAGALDSAKLTRECRKATVLVLAVRGADTEAGSTAKPPEN